WTYGGGVADHQCLRSLEPPSVGREVSARGGVRGHRPGRAATEMDARREDRVVGGGGGRRWSRFRCCPAAPHFRQSSLQLAVSIEVSARPRTYGGGCAEHQCYRSLEPPSVGPEGGARGGGRDYRPGRAATEMDARGEGR